MRRQTRWFLFGAILLVGGCATTQQDLEACLTFADKGFRPIAEERGIADCRESGSSLRMP